MKKLMALCLAMLMALSMCSFTAMAEEVDFSVIANGQPQNFVVANLNLGEHTITSSNTDVIALDGTVTRPLFEDATVQVAIDGGTAVDVVVKAMTVDAKDYYDFGTDGNVADDADWTFTATNASATAAVSNGEAKFNMYAESGERATATYTYYGKGSSAPTTVAFDLSDIATNGSVSNGIDVRLTLKRFDADGNVIDDISNLSVARITTSAAGYGWGAKAGTLSNGKFILKLNGSTGEMQIANNAGTFVDASTYTTSGTTYTLFTYNSPATPVASVVLNNIQFVSAGGGYGASFDVDNFVIYEDVDATEVLANATAQQKLNYYSKYLEESYVANGGSLTAVTGNLNFTADEELADGVSLVWTSNDEAIAADGTVKRPISEAKTVTITGTLAVGEESISKSYNVTLLPLTIAGQSEVLTFEDYASGTELASEANWKQNTTVVFNAVIDDSTGDSFAKLTATGSTSAVSNALVYTFQNVPSATNARYYVMKAKAHVPTAGSNAINLALMLNDTKAGEFMLGSAGWTGYIYGGALLTSNPWHTRGTAVNNSRNNTVPTSDYVDLEIKIDLAEGKVYYYQNGLHTETVTYTEGTTYVPDLTSIETAKLAVNWRSNTGEVWLDDVYLYAENTFEGVLGSLSDADKVAFYKDLIAGSDVGTASVVGAQLDLDAGYADYAPADYGVTVDWASDNTAYIANDGTVAKLAPYGTAVSVNMTATITAGSESDTVVIAVPVADETTLLASTDFSDTSVASGNASYTTDDDEHGSVLTLKNDTEGSHAGSGTISSITGAGRADRVIFEADVKYTHNGASDSRGGIGIKTYAGKAGINVYLNYLTGKVQATTTTAYIAGGANGLMANAAESIYFDMPASVKEKGEGAWVNLMVDHNVLSQTYHIYLDGVLVNELPILQANMDLGSNGGAAIRGYSLELSSKGEIWVDNISLSKYSDTNAVEVNAALNAALVQFASELTSPVLVNQELPAMTIGKSWVSGSDYIRDLDDSSALKPTNVATYTYVTDGPAITYAVDGTAVTAIDVASPKEVQLTITAAANGITESKTVSRKLAPVVIRDLALGTADCLNGAWIEGADGTEKLIVAAYAGSKLVSAKVVNLSETTDEAAGTLDCYDETTGIVNNLSTSHPVESAEYDAVKIFIVNADGITPVAHVNADLHE